MTITDAAFKAEADLAYLSLDFSPGSPAAEQLMGELQEEANLSRHRLTDRIGSMPADITAVMAGWYSSYVASTRQTALAEVDALGGSLDRPSAGNHVFLEAELDRIEDERLQQKRAAISSNSERNQTRYRRLGELRMHLEEAQRRFQDLRNQHNREPRRVNWLLYGPFLIIIGIAEFMINFESFSSLRMFTPAIATGTAVVVAIAVAFSSHFWGTAIKQLAVRLDPARNERDRWGLAQMISLGTGTLAFVLGVVWYARNSYFADEIARQIALGGVLPDPLQIIGGSLLSNMVVWILGVLAAYVAHDSDPAFPEAQEAMIKAQRQHDALETSLSKPLQQQFVQIDARADNAVKAANSRHSALSGVDQHIQSRRLFDRIAEQDARVLALLVQYRSRLVSRALKAAEQKRSVTFERAQDIYPDKRDILGPTEYAALTLRLKYV